LPSDAFIPVSAQTSRAHAVNHAKVDRFCQAAFIWRYRFPFPATALLRCEYPIFLYASTNTGSD